MRKLVSLAVSAAILILLWLQLDPGEIREALAQTDLGLLAASLGLLVALVVASGARLWALGHTGRFPLSPREAVEATLAANALNLFLPGKLGDLVKASLMAEDDPSRLPGALVLGVWEKLSELALLFVLASAAFLLAGGEIPNALLTGALGLTGLILLLRDRPLAALLRRLPKMRSLADAWSAGVESLRARPVATSGILFWSLLIWLGHLVQVLLMAAALGVEGPWLLWVSLAARVPIAILAGLIPLTFAGVGTRDAALVVLLGPLVGTETAAALGVLFLLRYLVPGLLGLPLLPRVLRATAALAARPAAAR